MTDARTTIKEQDPKTPLLRGSGAVPSHTPLGGDAERYSGAADLNSLRSEETRSQAPNASFHHVVDVDDSNSTNNPNVAGQEKQKIFTPPPLVFTVPARPSSCCDKFLKAWVDYVQPYATGPVFDYFGGWVPLAFFGSLGIGLPAATPAGLVGALAAASPYLNTTFIFPAVEFILKNPRVKVDEKTLKLIGAVLALGAGAAANYGGYAVATLEKLGSQAPSLILGAGGFLLSKLPTCLFGKNKPAAAAASSADRSPDPDRDRLARR